MKSIRHYRKQNRPIYYLDETWVSAGETTNKTPVNQNNKKQKNPSGKGKRLIVMYKGSSEGFVPAGLLSFESNDEINGNTFFIFNNFFI